jgi:N-acyl-D-amino-acid deacylase
MKQVVPEGLEAGAVGLSYERNTRHVDHEGRVSPTNVASDRERYALASVLDEVGHGTLQVGGSAKLGIGLAQAGGRPVFYGGIAQNAADPDRWKQDMNEAEDYGREGLRAFRLLNPMPTLLRYTLKTAQHFDALPSWKPVMTAPLAEKKRLLADPGVRAKLHYEAVDTPYSGANGEFCKRWDLQIVFKTALPKNAGMEGKSVAQVAAETGRDVLDTFLDLALEEDLDTVFERHERNGDPEAMAEMLNSPNILVGQSDGGAHVVFRTTYAYPTYLLGHWVREKKILSLESAVRKLSFESASVLGLGDRGLIRPGFVADMMVFDPETIGPLEPEETQDLPGGAIRRKQLATGIEWTTVNGEVLMEHGEPVGAFPGKVIRGGRV